MICGPYLNWDNNTDGNIGAVDDDNDDDDDDGDDDHRLTHI